MAEKVKSKGDKGERKSLVPLGSLERGRKELKQSSEISTERERKKEGDTQNHINAKNTENMTKIIDLLSFYFTKVLETPCCVDLEDKPLIVCSQVLDNVRKEKEKSSTGPISKEGDEKKD